MNDFGCKHSDSVQKYFEIASRGVDYINDFGTMFEFKESWCKDIKQMFFKVPRHQLEHSDYIVFFIYDKEFYVHDSAYILNKYSFKNVCKHCCLRYNTIRKNYIDKFSNYRELKEYIDSRDLRL